MTAWTGVRGKRVIITGATGGIGLAAAEALAARGARLAIVGRDQTRAREAADRCRAAGGDGTEVDVLLADLAVQASVRRLAAEILDRFPTVEVLINNAGAVYSTWQLTGDGIERTWAVNHLAPFLLTNLLLERLKESAPARVIATASAAHQGARIPFDDLDGRRAYGRRFLSAGFFRRYGESKLANILFTAELARRLAGTEVTASCFHPGVVASGFNRNNGGLMSAAMVIVKPFSRSPEKGAETLVWLADSPEAADQNGGYFVDRKRSTPSVEARDAETAARLWKVSEEQTSASLRPH